VACDDPGVLVHAALALAFFGEDIGAMTALVDRSLVFNPNFAHGWHVSGALRQWAGQPDIAIEHVEAALRLSPHRIGSSLSVIGRAHLLAVVLTRQYRNCSSRSRRTRVIRPRIVGSPPVTRIWGGSDKAREIVQQLRAITSVVIPDVSHYRNAEQRELFLSGLRLAAGEAT
jgi:hypothetical protein